MLPTWTAPSLLLLLRLAPIAIQTEQAIQLPLNLAPPIGRTVDRDSSTFGVQQYDYGDVETAEDVGWDNYKTVVDGIMEMLSRTGLAHGYSYNTWSDVVTYTDTFIEELASVSTDEYVLLTSSYAKHASQR